MIHSTKSQFAWVCALALAFGMESRVVSATTDSTQRSTEIQSASRSRHLAKQSLNHSEVSPPEPGHTKKELNRNCSLFSDYVLLQAALPKAFDLLDKNRDGLLTKNELAAQIDDTHLSPIEGGLLAGFYENFDELSGLSRTFWFGKKFDRSTLDAFLRTVKKSEPPLAIARKAWYWTESSEPAAIGLDFQKGCTKEQLQNASRNEQISEKAKTIVDYLLNNFNAVSSDNLCTYKAVTHFYRQLRLSKPEFEITFYVEDCLETARVFADDKLSQNLYWHQNKPLDDIRGDNIVQGDAGDCTFKSVLIGLANSRPQNIAKMIRRLDKDSFSVTFPENDPIVVKAPSWAEQTLYVPDRHSGIWQALIEKAYGELGARQDKEHHFDNCPIEEKTAVLWHPQTAIKILTGHESEFVFFAKVNDKDVVKKLRKAFANPIAPIVIAGTQEPSDKRLDAGHSFIVEKITGAPGSKEEKVVLRNAHSFRTEARGSLLSLSPTEFWENFNDVTIEQFK